MHSLSVIIPTYNRSQLLSYSLESLAQQSISTGEFEVVVADDGSADNTREVVQEYSNRLNIVYVQQEDRGYRVASARNMGIKASSGNICLFIDSGVIVDGQCVQSHVDFHAGTTIDSAALGYVYGFGDYVKRSPELLNIINPEAPSETIEKIAKEKKYFDVREIHYRRYRDHINDSPAPWQYFWTCHVSVQKKNLLHVGLFDENYDGRWGIEDNDLGFRLHQNGVKIAVLRQARSVHYPHEKNSAERNSQGYQNCIYFNKKYDTPETRKFLENYRDL